MCVCVWGGGGGGGGVLQDKKLSKSENVKKYHIVAIFDIL